MNIKTIAKQVENVFTLNQLKETGIDYAQGFYLDKPEHINKQIKEIIKSMQLYSVKH
jgi:EAL domain-containing protein (putative c-di-GMP-specific phosphodiesterase class I)